MPKDLVIVTSDNLHHTINSYITDNNITINNYHDMIETVLSMIKGGHCFNLDRERLRDCMEDLTYMFSPDDDLNKDRIVQGLEYETDDDSFDESHDDEDDDSIEDIVRDDLDTTELLPQ